MAEDDLTPSSRRTFLGGLAAVAAAAGTIRATAGTAEARAGASSARTRSISASSQNARLAEALRLRQAAADMAATVDPPVHLANGDERADFSYALSFTKGLPHDYGTGLVDRARDFEQFVRAIESGDGDDIRAVPLGPRSGFRTVADDAQPNARVRGWETPAAGLAFDLVGFDPQSCTIPPAPRAGSAELTGELAEIYAMAVLRDEPLSGLQHEASSGSNRDRMIDALGALAWFNADAYMTGSPEALARRRTGLTPQTAFRGLTPGETTGPYVSQLLLVGSPSVSRGPHDGIIEYGAQTIDQRVRRVGRTDFMTSWDAWFDVQNGLSPAVGPPDTGLRRFITTGRDLATYVHADALYQPYFNACLVLLANGIPLDPSLPYQRADEIDHQQGFVLYAMPHVLSMLGEVCSRALKTVFFQKFGVHRRLRPEALAARIDKADEIGIPEISRMAARLDESVIGEDIRRSTSASSGTESMLLPMAYGEGSPMHPSYGAGHATVAGACVTILKTFFDHSRPFAATGDPSTAYVAVADGSQLAPVQVRDANGAPAALTVEGELNKLAANIAIARNWAGVHYFSDYWESMLLGEQVAIEILREHMLTVPESFHVAVPKFDGTRLWL